VWQNFLVPSLEGQYIIKNIVIVALALSIGGGRVSTAPAGALEFADCPATQG
jgi:hypothetical protein